MSKHIRNKPLKYTTLNRYLKKRSYKKKATSLTNAALSFNCMLSSTTFLNEKRKKKVFLNKKMFKTLVISEPISFGLLSLIIVN